MPDDSISRISHRPLPGRLRGYLLPDKTIVLNRRMSAQNKAQALRLLRNTATPERNRHVT